MKSIKAYLLDHHQSLRKLLYFLMIVASVVLIINISIETFQHDAFVAHAIYLQIQFWICIFFTVNFFIFFLLAEKKIKFLMKYSILLLFCIPYLSLLNYTSIKLTPEQIYLIGSLPLFRGGLALVMLILLLVKRNTTALFISYNLLLFAVVYFISLIFFIFERNVNHEVHTYKDALWWAGMTVTTLGPNIIPVTDIGRILTIVLAGTGMTAFPIFTVYLTSVVNRFTQNERDAKHNDKQHNQN
ncbi:MULTISPECIES: potassium channel family protein [unclassified Acinetobacter]|uniref:potassium channel family protein n=1 Tax=unclassified Acinetobacter TaxID=196816 RepID=UPI0029345968|nr:MULTISPECIES: potassium channel family protein [unclassified Acinetobacter]WOE31849.1 potassium channel family protein [Acinetobacter sp. SAAs470]WOE37316.1 potassium channel family protein [Acinetobacter sp. SAAs474]